MSLERLGRAVNAGECEGLFGWVGGWVGGERRMNCCRRTWVGGCGWVVVGGWVVGGWLWVGGGWVSGWETYHGRFSWWEGRGFQGEHEGKAVVDDGEGAVVCGWVGGLGWVEENEAV